MFLENLLVEFTAVLKKRMRLAVMIKQSKPPVPFPLRFLECALRVVRSVA